MSGATNTKVLRLDPRSFVSIKDVISNGRKLAVLDDKGIGYFDLLGPSELPKALLSGLDPVVQPSISELLANLTQEEMEEITIAWDQMTQNNVDVLTIYRAIHWAVENKSTDVELIQRMGVEATERIIAGRNMVEKAFS